MEQAQRQHSRKDEPDTAEQAPADLRDEQLSEEISCCLAEIDEVLTETQGEKDRAKEEFEKLRSAYRNGSATEKATEDAMRLWQAQYAHLGLKFGWCCSGPYMYED